MAQQGQYLIFSIGFLLLTVVFLVKPIQIIPASICFAFSVAMYFLSKDE